MEELALRAINLGCLLTQILSHFPVSEPSVAERERNMLSHIKMNTEGKFPTLTLAQPSSPLPWWRNAELCVRMWGWGIENRWKYTLANAWHLPSYNSLSERCLSIWLYIGFGFFSSPPFSPVHSPQFSSPGNALSRQSLHSLVYRWDTCRKVHAKEQWTKTSLTVDTSVLISLIFLCILSNIF